MNKWAIAFVFLLISAMPCLAIEAGEQLKDAALEKRAMQLGQQLRCVVCQSESINDSPAGLAKDLRTLVRAKLQDGMTDAQILDFIHARYGDYVLLSPPVNDATVALWIAPWAFLGVGFALFALFVLNNRGWTKD
ncbi:MAG: cytochrome c-type biogenesis protein [Alphaproteobacteria bacterium]|nr:cytochrome c-type biogenesis protein [Alphaproteobacteria bacterium]